MTMIEAGKTYLVRDWGMAVTIVWIDGDDVHYREKGSGKVEMTTLDRLSGDVWVVEQREGK